MTTALIEQGNNSYVNQKDAFIDLIKDEIRSK